MAIDQDLSLTKLPELTVSNDKSAESAKTLHGLLSVLLGSLLVNRGLDTIGVAGADSLGLPDEVLEQVAVILAEKQDLGLLNDMAQISNEFLTIRGEVLGWRLEVLPFKGRVHSNVDLGILQQAN